MQGRLQQPLSRLWTPLLVDRHDGPAAPLFDIHTGFGPQHSAAQSSRASAGDGRGASSIAGGGSLSTGGASSNSVVSASGSVVSGRPPPAGSTRWSSHITSLQRTNGSTTASPSGVRGAASSPGLSSAYSPAAAAAAEGGAGAGLMSPGRAFSKRASAVDTGPHDLRVSACMV